MFARLGDMIFRWRWMTLAAGLAFMLASGLLGVSVFSDMKSGGYDDPGAESHRVSQLLKSQLGEADRFLIVLFRSKSGERVESSSFRSEVEATLSRLDGDPYVEKVLTYYSTAAPAFVSRDGYSTYALVGLQGDDDQQLRNMERLRPLLTSPILDVKLGGYPAVSQEITELVQEDLERAEIVTFPIVFVLLVIIFGSLLAASLPLFIGGFAILGGLLILRLTTSFADVSIFAANVVTMLGLGLAIDYALFMVSRFREELVAHDGDTRLALTRTMQTAGRTVIFSGLTVMISLLSLLVFPQMFLQSMGWGGAAAVLVAMLGAVTVLPATLALMGRRVNSLSVLSLLPRRVRPATHTRGAAEGGAWYRISRFVMRHPIWVLALAVAPLLIAGLPFFRLNLSIPDHRALPEGADSREVGEALRNDFPSNETQPIQVVVKSRNDATSRESLSALFDYTRQVKRLPGVVRVDSLVTLDPLLDVGGASAYAEFYAAAARPGDPRAPLAQRALEQYANGNYSEVRVVYSGEMLGEESKSLVRQIRGVETPRELEALVGGYTAQLVDFLDSLASRVPLALGLIVGVMFLLLFLMLGSVVVPLKAVILNILSLSASFGALVFIFQDGNLANLLNFTPTGSIDGTMPVIIFAIAFGLSMDYEVFLLSRIKEQYDHTGETVQAVATGVQRTGGIITSAALVLVVVIAGFAFGDVLFIKQVGIGLGLAVIVDATLVRTLLVPATMRLLGRYNWWAPKPLRWVYERLGMGEQEADDVPEALQKAASETTRARA